MSADQTPPGVVEAERIVLGAMMLNPAVIDDVCDQIRSGDFHDTRHGGIFAVIVANHANQADVGPVAVAMALDRLGELQRVGGTPYLHSLIAAVPTVANATWYAEKIAEEASARRMREEATRLLHKVTETSDRAKIAAAVADLVAATAERPVGPATVRPGVELDAFLGADDEQAYDWLIPGLLERRDRLILTGGEGDGKSTLLRQLGVQAASGVHPFGGNDFEPLRVLLLDLENSERQLRREIRPLRLAAGNRYAGGLFVELRGQGLNLLDDDDKAWFVALLAAHKPDLLITGPAYKMVAGDPIEEGPARLVAGMLDRARGEHGCAVLLEAHTPHATNGGRRPPRPYGASLWLRWPEFGLHLSPDGRLKPWRGARDASREWPTALNRGGEWPWTPMLGREDPKPLGDVLAEEELATLDAIAKLVADGKEPNLRNVRTAVRPQSNERTDVILDRLKRAGRIIETPGPRNARLFTVPQDPIPGVTP